MQEAVGQYEVYRTLLAENDPGRLLYLAVSSATFEGIFAERFGQLMIARLQLRVLVFDDGEEKVVQWIS
jgi:hypothetical protein